MKGAVLATLVICLSLCNGFTWELEPTVFRREVAQFGTIECLLSTGDDVEEALQFCLVELAGRPDFSDLLDAFYGVVEQYDRETSECNRAVARYFSKLNAAQVTYVILGYWERILAPYPFQVLAGSDEDQQSMEALHTESDVKTACLDENWLQVLPPQSVVHYRYLEARIEAPGAYFHLPPHLALLHELSCGAFISGFFRSDSIQRMYDLVAHTPYVYSELMIEACPSPGFCHSKDLWKLAQTMIAEPAYFPTSVESLPYVFPFHSMVDSRKWIFPDLQLLQRSYHVVHGGSKVVVRQSTGDNAFHECSVMELLSGPHFPEVVRYWQADEGYGACMHEFVQGLPLQSSLVSIQTTKTLFSFVESVVAILAALRAAGVQHNDFTHNNIIIRDGIPVLIDFDRSEANSLPNTYFTLDSLSALEDFNPAYLNASGDFDDVYSAGVMLQWLFTQKGLAPLSFRYDTVVDIMLAGVQPDDGDYGPLLDRLNSELARINKDINAKKPKRPLSTSLMRPITPHDYPQLFPFHRVNVPRSPKQFTRWFQDEPSPALFPFFSPDTFHVRTPRLEYPPKEPYLAGVGFDGTSSSLQALAATAPRSPSAWDMHPKALNTLIGDDVLPSTDTAVFFSIVTSSGNLPFYWGDEFVAKAVEYSEQSEYPSTDILASVPFTYLSQAGYSHWQPALASQERRCEPCVWDGPVPQTSFCTHPYHFNTDPITFLLHNATKMPSVQLILEYRGVESFLLTTTNIFPMPHDTRLEVLYNALALSASIFAQQSVVELGAHHGFASFVAVLNRASSSIAYCFDEFYTEAIARATSAIGFANVLSAHITSMEEFTTPADIAISVGLTRHLYHCRPDLFPTVHALVKRLRLHALRHLVVGWVDGGRVAFSSERAEGGAGVTGVDLRPSLLWEGRGGGGSGSGGGGGGGGEEGVEMAEGQQELTPEALVGALEDTGGTVRALVAPSPSACLYVVSFI